MIREHRAPQPRKLIFAVAIWAVGFPGVGLGQPLAEVLGEATVWARDNEQNALEELLPLEPTPDLFPLEETGGEEVEKPFNWRVIVRMSPRMDPEIRIALKVSDYLEEPTNIRVDVTRIETERLFSNLKELREKNPTSSFEDIVKQVPVSSYTCSARALLQIKGLARQFVSMKISPVPPFPFQVDCERYDFRVQRRWAETRFSLCGAPRTYIDDNSYSSPLLEWAQDLRAVALACKEE